MRRILDECAPTFTNEAGLHDGLEIALRHAGLDVQREVRLSPRDRVDLMCGSTVIEVKIGGSWESAYRQLLRYAKHTQVHDLILVTTKPAHIVHIPAKVGGVPVHFILKGGMF